MFNTDYLSFILLPIGIVGLFRPTLLLYTMTVLPVLWSAPYLKSSSTGFKILSIGSIELYDMDFFFLLLALSIFLILFSDIIIKKGSLRNSPVNAISMTVLALFLWNIVIAVLSYQKGFYLQNILRILSREAIIFIAVFIPILKSRGLSKDRIFNLTIYLGILLTVFAFFKYYVSNEIEYTSSGTVRTLLGNNVVIFLIPICYLLFLNTRTEKVSLKTWIVIVLIAMGINFTGHRSGWTALLFVIMAYMLSIEFNLKDYIWIPMLGMSAIIAFTVFIIPMMKLETDKSLIQDMVIRISDTLDLNNHTTLERFSKWEQCFEIAKKHPFLGLARFPVYTDSVGDNRNLQIFDEFNRAPHNLFANVLAHQGFAGLFGLFLFFSVILGQLTYLKDEDPKTSRFIAIYTLAFIVFSLFNTSFSSTHGKFYFAVIIGFLNAEIMELKSRHRSTFTPSTFQYRKVHEPDWN